MAPTRKKRARTLEKKARRAQRFESQTTGCNSASHDTAMQSERYVKMKSSGASSALAIFPLFMPGLLDGFEFCLVGFLRIAGKAGEFGDPFVHVSEADGVGIGVGMRVGQADGDVVEIFPIE